MSPTLFASLWSPERAVEPYLTLDDFMADVLRILCDEVRELVRLGCGHIQLDAPHYPLLIDPTWRAFYELRDPARGVGSLTRRSGCVDDLAAFDGVDVPGDAVHEAPL